MLAFMDDGFVAAILCQLCDVLFGKCSALINGDVGIVVESCPVSTSLYRVWRIQVSRPINVGECLRLCSENSAAAMDDVTGATANGCLLRG
jgi:hypothetical protein